MGRTARDPPSGGEPLVWAKVHFMADVNIVKVFIYLHVLVDVRRGLGLVIAKLAGKGLPIRVFVLDVAVEVGLVGAGHLTVGALVMVDV